MVIGVGTLGHLEFAEGLPRRDAQLPWRLDRQIVTAIPPDVLIPFVKNRSFKPIGMRRKGHRLAAISASAAAAERLCRP